MAGLYRGGRDYDLRFVELADFGDLAGAGPAVAGERDAAIRAAMRALRRDARVAVPRGALQLVQLLRLLGRCRHADLAERHALSDADSLAATIAAIGLAVAATLVPPGANAAAFDLGALTALLGRVKSGEATFVESRRIEMLDRTLAIVGPALVSRPPTASFARP